MKASAFAYARATSVVNALELLGAHGEGAKVLSGGQSLMPAMNLRLISPELIVDIGEIAELRGIAVTGDVVRIGGSLAHADPASELPACMLALNAIIIIRGQAGERRIAARDFFTGIYETALSAQELLVAVELPAARKNSVHFFHEFARRHGDYAIAGLAAQAIVEGDVIADLRLAFFAVGDRPILAKAAEKLVKTAITPAILSETSTALGDELDPHDDQQASASMRRHLAKVLLARCVSALLRRPDLDAGGPV